MTRLSTTEDAFEGVNAFIKAAPENPVLWTGMKGASTKGRKNVI
jgi:hypothetical protein